MSIVVNKTRLPVTQWQTESGSVVSISDARKRYAKSLSVALEPIQDTSGGDPSPANICPISGHSAVNVYDDPKYGGKIWWNQLASLDTSDWDLRRISMSVDGHSVTLTPTSDATGVLKRANILGLIVGHKYISMMTVIAGSTRGLNWGIYTHVNSNDYTSREIISKPTSDTFYAHFWDVTTAGSMLALVLATSANTSDQVGLQNIQLFDLTAMFGAGNEPTLEQFRALFPKDYYDYNAGTETLVSAVNGDPHISVTVQLGQTIYDGTVDLVSGVLTADMVSQNITTCVNGSSNYARYVIGGYGYIDASASYCNVLVKHSGSAGSLSEGKYMVLNSPAFDASQAIFCFAGCRGSSSSTTRNLNQEKLTELNNAGTPLQIVYKLATPITYQLTPTQIEMLMRDNTIWSDDGIVTVNYARIRS